MVAAAIQALVMQRRDRTQLRQGIRSRQDALGVIGVQSYLLPLTLAERAGLNPNAAKISFMRLSAALFGERAHRRLDRRALSRRPNQVVGAPVGARRSDPLSRPDRLAVGAAPSVARGPSSAVGAATDT